uniref:Uncharacterized protein n=1 Tax=Eutreptiella gymnastica TaxID=73025 RepID=A0A7S1NSD3_9EUGL
MESPTMPLVGYLSDTMSTAEVGCRLLVDTLHHAGTLARFGWSEAERAIQKRARSLSHTAVLTLPWAVLEAALGPRPGDGAWDSQTQLRRLAISVGLPPATECRTRRGGSVWPSPNPALPST